MSHLSGKSANTTNNPQQQSATTSNSNQQPTTSSNQDIPIPEEDQPSPTAKHSNPLVATGVIPANLYETFIFPEINQQKKQPQVNTKSHVLTSDKQMQMYDEKNSKKREAEDAKQKSKDERERRKAEKEKQKKQGGGVRTRGRFRMRGGSIRTRGGKRNWRYIPPEDSSTEEVEHDEEDWECKACGEDNGVASDFLGCDTCDQWFHIRCVNKSADNFFQCQYCQ